MTEPVRRRLPIGAEVQPTTGVHFRVWAPDSTAVSVVIGDRGDRVQPLTADAEGYFSGLVEDARAGTRYKFRVGDGHDCPDPASRFQPDGPHGSSEVIDPAEFVWTDRAWSGLSSDGLVVYEMHVGTFSEEGTFDAAARQLPALADLGVTVIELMPIADFPGRFGWGYDGVDLFAPTRLYGRPSDLRHFVARAHALGLGVILDVVYNHFGPDGNYLERFATNYFAKTETEWGRAINFDGEQSGPVREFFETNARHWIEEYHLDGLRLDATQQIFDRSPEHIVSVIGRTVRQAAGRRRTWVVGENEPQHARFLRPTNEGGYGIDALWNDDFHHAAMVAMTGRREAYYTDYLGRPQEFISCARSGFLFQGQYYTWQKKGRGQRTDGLPPSAFVSFLQNHDQVANSGDGQRLHRIGSEARARALTALLLLGPWTPMLFQGQEFAASTPFLYFADHPGALGDQVRSGRLEFLSQFPSLRTLIASRQIADPGDPDTFAQCRLNHAERQLHAPAVAMHTSLLRLRREDGAFGATGQFEGAVLGGDVFVFRCRPARASAPPSSSDRLLVVNLGAATTIEILSEPLLAPQRHDWQLAWSSEDVRFGGSGTALIANAAGWHIPAESATVLQ